MSTKGTKNAEVGLVEQWDCESIGKNH